MVSMRNKKMIILYSVLSRALLVIFCVYSSDNNHNYAVLQSQTWAPEGQYSDDSGKQILYYSLKVRAIKLRKTCSIFNKCDINMIR